MITMETLRRNLTVRTRQVAGGFASLKFSKKILKAGPYLLRV